MGYLGYKQAVAPFAHSGALPRMIGLVGEPGFHSALLSFLHESVGAEHCAIVRFIDDRPVKVGASSLDGTNTAGQQMDLYLNSYWRFDPTMVAAHDMIAEAPTSLMRLDVGGLPPSGLRDLVYRRQHISERLLLSGSAAGGRVSLSILRSERLGKFSEGEVGRLLDMAGTLLALAGKHADLVTRQSELSLALTSLPTIVDCMAHAPENLPRRETEVCARILFGVSSIGIGLELNIGEETVKTYRKRAYQRLGIATQRELLVWYIKRWSEQRSRAN